MPEYLAKIRERIQSAKDERARIENRLIRQSEAYRSHLGLSEMEVDDIIEYFMEKGQNFLCIRFGELTVSFTTRRVPLKPGWVNLIIATAEHQDCAIGYNSGLRPYPIEEELHEQILKELSK